MAAASWLRRAALVFALGLSSASVLPQIDERAMKAAYLFNFLQFTQWPVPPDEPFRLCVLGRTPLDDHLDSLKGKVVLGDRHISVQHVDMQANLADCHALYVDDSQRKQIDDVLRRLNGTPVLTITDGDGLADRGVMIEIHKRNLKLGFEVNLEVARRANINFSARMLKLASFVSGATEAGAQRGSRPGTSL